MSAWRISGRGSRDTGTITALLDHCALRCRVLEYSKFKAPETILSLVFKHLSQLFDVKYYSVKNQNGSIWRARRNARAVLAT